MVNKICEYEQNSNMFFFFFGGFFFFLGYTHKNMNEKQSSFIRDKLIAKITAKHEIMKKKRKNLRINLIEFYYIPKILLYHLLFFTSYKVMKPCISLQQSLP